MKPILLLLFTVFVLNTVFAVENYSPAVSPKDNYLQDALTPEHFERNKQVPLLLSDDSESLAATEQSLLNNPQLLQRVMESALMRRSIPQIKAVLPIYQKVNYADPILVNYAQALINHNEGNYEQAIDFYRQILAKQPDLSPIRYSLAIALYQNKQFANALQQFEKLQSLDLPEPMKNSVNNAVTAIKQEEDWRFDVNFYIKQEKNINNAPTQRTLKFGSGQFIFAEPEKATGIHLDLGAHKRFNWESDWYSSLHFNLNGDYFWDNKEYNDINLRAGFATGYENARLTAEIEPFVRKRFFGNASYSSTIGAETYFKYRLTPQFSLSNTTSFAYEKFDNRHHLNGRRQFTNLMALYIPDAEQYWFVGANLFNSTARYRDDSFINKGVYLGWGQEWYKGMSSKLVLSPSKVENKV